MGQKAVQQKTENPGLALRDRLKPDKLCEQTLVRYTGYAA